MTYHDYVNRRWFLKECGLGLGMIAPQALLQDGAALAQGTANRLASSRKMSPCFLNSYLAVYGVTGWTWAAPGIDPAEVICWPTKTKACDRM